MFSFIKTLIEKTVKKERKKLYVAFIDFKKAYELAEELEDEELCAIIYEYQIKFFSK